MTAPRTASRERGRDLLKGQTAAGDRVFSTRKVPWTVAELPAISIYTPEETVEAASRLTAPRKSARNLSLVIEAVVEQGDDPDAAMDAIALEIENAIDLHEALDGLAGEWWWVEDCWLVRTDMDTYEDGRRELGIVKLTYDVQYKAYTNTADLADARTAHVRYTVNGQAEADGASDTVKLSDD